MRPQLTHIALHVRDLAASVSFYQDFCGLEMVRDRRREPSPSEVVWLAEPGRAQRFIFVLIDGGPVRPVQDGDYGHLGFALGSRQEVDEVAARGRAAGCLAWEPRGQPWPVGYYCGLKDPDGTFVEFSFGQPLGPGALDGQP